MFYSSPSEAMDAIRVELDNIKGDPALTQFGKKTGFLDFGFSSANPTGVHEEMLRSSNNSNFRAIKLTYYQRDYGSSIENTPEAFTCDPGADKQLQTEIVKPTLFSADKFTVGEAYMREVMEDGNLDDIINNRFLEKMRVLRENVDLQMLTKVGTKIGANPAAGTAAGAYQPIELLTANSELQYANFNAIKNQMEDNLISGNFAAIGLGYLRHYFDLMKISAVNDQGADYQEIMNNLGYGFLKDQNVATALGTPSPDGGTTPAVSGANRFVVLAPGAVHPYVYNLNRGQFNIKISDTEGKGTIQDVVYPNLYWDYDYAYQRCSGPDSTSGEYLFRIWAYYDVHVLPTTAFNAADPLYGMNGVFGYEATKAA